MRWFRRRRSAGPSRLQRASHASSVLLAERDELTAEMLALTNQYAECGCGMPVPVQRRYQRCLERVSEINAAIGTYEHPWQAREEKRIAAELHRDLGLGDDVEVVWDDRPRGR